MATTKATFNVVSSALASGNATDGYVLTADGSGNVAWEEVAGGPTFKTFGTNSIMLGSNSTGTINAADYNTAVSTTAFAALTTGDFNVAFGEQALDALTTGGGNVAIGVATLGALDTANNNTAVGMSAMTSNTSGTLNVGLGSDAMAINTTGSNNVAVGSLALYANTTGVSNVAVGKSALTANTTASNNTAVGYNAGTTFTTGFSNVVMGSGAMQSSTTGTYNVAIGVNALYQASSANDNTVVGRHAGYSQTTGDANTFLGYAAGNTTTTGGDNTIVGKSSVASSATTGSQVIVGKGLTGYGGGWIVLGAGSLRTRVDGGATNWAGDSDERLKENVQTSTAGLSFINDLRPVTFDWKKKKNIPTTLAAYKEGSEERVRPNSGTNNHGFIAQEIKTALDNHSEVLEGHDLWQEDSADGTQGVAPTALVPMLVKAIQELSAEVETLKSQIGE